MSKISTSDLQGIVSAAQDVILLLAGKHPNYGGKDCVNMVNHWDHLNDKAAPPAVVKAMADDLINCRKQSAILSHENEKLGETVAYWMKRAQEAEKRAHEAERELKKITCNHGFAPGQHTMGKIGCVDCCGEDVYLWDYAPGGKRYDASANPHEHTFTSPIGGVEMGHHKHEGGK